MEASIFGVITEGFIPCVNNCPAELYPLVNLRDNVIGTLRDLVADEIVALMVGIPKFENLFMPANAAGTRINLARDKERQQRRNNDLVEGRRWN